jgi:2-polyprenyl-3-methyl-5-hydroxy-6-metoxy-1,4-benzoquinol methylase
MGSAAAVVKLRRAWDGAAKWAKGVGTACPSCGAPPGSVVDRKKLITYLRRCGACRLLYRTPTVEAGQNEDHYNSGGDLDFAATLPGSDRLAELVASGFSGQPGDFGPYLDVLAALGCRPGRRVLDFGCSWGYLSWQLSQAGYIVQGFEINRGSCRYGRDQLGIDARESLDGLDSPFDVVFSNHVLEHIPSLSETIGRLWSMIRPGGLFIAFTPNGCEAARKSDPANWHAMWGSGHPNFLDEDFYKNLFRGAPKVLASTTHSPYTKDREMLKSWGNGETDDLTLDLSGEELLFAARKPDGTEQIGSRLNISVN